MKDATIINIDNNSANAGFGDIVLVSNKFSSLSEQVADLMLNLDIDFDTDVAQNMLSGIMQATNNFQDQGTSFLAFEIAAILMKRGAVRASAGVTPRMERQPEVRIQQPRNDQPREQRPQPQAAQQVQQQPREDRREAIRDALRQRAQGKNDQQRPQPQSQPQSGRGDYRQSESKPPSDWLTPKVYKGSSDVS